MQNEHQRTGVGSPRPPPVHRSDVMGPDGHQTRSGSVLQLRNSECPVGRSSRRSGRTAAGCIDGPDDFVLRLCGLWHTQRDVQVQQNSASCTVTNLVCVVFCLLFHDSRSASLHTDALCRLGPWAMAS